MEKKNQQEPKTPPKPAEIKPVGAGERKKKSLGTKMKETFISTNLPDIKGNIVKDIFIPSAKNMVLDAIRSIATGTVGAAEMMLFGRMSGRRIDGYSNRSNRDYSTISSRIRYESDSRSVRTSRSLTPMQRASFNFDSIIFSRVVEGEDGRPKGPKQQALDVIENMIEWINMYGEASVQIFYQFAGQTNYDYTETEWGWKNFDMARVEELPGHAFTIVCPRPIYLKNT
jgi:hypothetical protein